MSARPWVFTRWTPPAKPVKKIAGFTPAVLAALGRYATAVRDRAIAPDYAIYAATVNRDAAARDLEEAVRREVTA